MRLAEQWDVIENGLDPRWSDARLVVMIDDESKRKRAAALLAPASPGLRGNAIYFHTARRGAGVGPEAVRRMVRRPDEEGSRGEAERGATGERQPQPVAPRPP